MTARYFLECLMSVTYLYKLIHTQSMKHFPQNLPSKTILLLTLDGREQLNYLSIMSQERILSTVMLKYIATIFSIYATPPLLYCMVEMDSNFYA